MTPFRVTKKIRKKLRYRKGLPSLHNMDLTLRNQQLRISSEFSSM